MNKSLLLVFFILTAFLASSQEEDSTKNLSEVVVKAYQQNRQLQQTSAAINYVSHAQLERFNNTNILPALNSTPGVRMEERSPGSYRMNVRGSTLRSPFGVRNVKVYWNEIPFTDPGGNTYLNQLSYYNFNSIEIIKGPGGSLYGAGTGGVILASSENELWKRGVDVNLSGGSYGLFNTALQLKAGTDKWQNTLNYSRQSSDGYRNHTRMSREVANWQMKSQLGSKDEITFTVLYGDLFYQTPGALTKAEFTANPRAARPKAGTLPSADSAKAAIYQKTVLTAIKNKVTLADGALENTTIIYGAFSEIKNPTFRNYEKRTEPHFGGRTYFTWLPGTMTRVVAGAEAQTGWFNTKTYVNKFGRPAAMMTDDKIRPTIFSLFAQVDVMPTAEWSFTAGISSNQASMEINRVSVANFVPVKRNFKNEIAPRLAVSRKLVDNLWAYASVAKGFSPPTVSEVLPSTTVISTDLQAEHGISYEGGIKGSWFNQRLYIEVNGFYYRLQNAIVQRKDLSNADYFANAGDTKQTGVESQVSYRIPSNGNSFLKNTKIWVSHTWNDFKYDDFKQGANDFSGKKLPSVAPQTLVAGLDMSFQKGISCNITYFYSDKIALNDANAEFASSYSLLGARVNYKHAFKKFIGEAFIGGENLLDATYSLGNDINAAGGRYYNVAAGRNFFAGLAFHISEWGRTPDQGRGNPRF